MTFLYFLATIALAILGCLGILVVGYVALVSAMLFCCAKLTCTCVKCAVNFVIERN